MAKIIPFPTTHIQRQPPPVAVASVPLVTPYAMVSAWWGMMDACADLWRGGVQRDTGTIERRIETLQAGAKTR